MIRTSVARRTLLVGAIGSEFQCGYDPGGRCEVCCAGDSWPARAQGAGP